MCYKFDREFREVVHIREFSKKHKVVRRYNSKVIPREMREDELILKKMVIPV